MVWMYHGGSPTKEQRGDRGDTLEPYGKDKKKMFAGFFFYCHFDSKAISYATRNTEFYCLGVNGRKYGHSVD